MHTDITKVRQVLLNLLSNASKFTNQGTVTVGAERRSSPVGDQIVFTVADTGLGMTPEQVQKLFTEFMQADSSTTRKYGGTGLGLAISKRFCNLLGGDISVQSEYEKGSVFTVLLPANPEGDAISAPSAEGAASQPIEGISTVLV